MEGLHDSTDLEAVLEEMAETRAREIVASREDALEEALQRVIAAWESLPGGRNYSAAQIQSWLKDTMAPAINAAREAVES